MNAPFDLKTWASHLSADEPLVLVIKGHLYVEAALIQLIEAALVNKQKFDPARLPFRMRVKLAVALGKIDPADACSLIALNSLRNQFAYDPNTQLTEKDELNIYNTLSPTQRNIVDSLRQPKMPFIVRLRYDIVGLILMLWDRL
jgi:hypothetical protein